MINVTGARPTLGHHLKELILQHLPPYSLKTKFHTIYSMIRCQDTKCISPQARSQKALESHLLRLQNRFLITSHHKQIKAGSASAALPKLVSSCFCVCSGHTDAK